MTDVLHDEQLGMEARSILKSIQTEHSKLVHAKQLTRSDRHYFRARHNYYKSSLLRLTATEQKILEPLLTEFHHQISKLEIGQEVIKSNEERSAPFLQLVETSEKPENNFSIGNSIFSNQKGELRSVVHQLQLIKLAFSAELSVQGQKIVEMGLDRALLELEKISTSQ